MIELTQQIINSVKQFFKNYKQIRNNYIQEYKIKFSKYNKVLQKYVISHKQWQTVKNLIKGILFNIELKKCKYCNKELGFHTFNTGSQYCSIKCAHNDPIIKTQMEQTCLNKYGVKSVSCVKEIRDKAKQTCKQKFGYEFPIQSLEIKQKVKQGCQQKFGTNAYTQTQQFKEKSKNTCKEKYGYEFAAQVPKLKEKQQQTCLKKYGKTCYLATQQNIQNKKQIMQQKFGVDYYSQTNQFKNKFKQTCNKKFGIDNPSKLNIIKDKVKQSHLNKFGVQHNKYLNMFETFKQWQKYIIPLFELKNYHGQDNIYNWKCTLCGNQFQSNIHTTRHIEGLIYEKMPRCLHCFPFLSGTSKKEQQLINYCKQYYPQLQFNYWKLLGNLQVDIYIQQINLAIEFNGLHWHDINHKDVRLPFK